MFQLPPGYPRSLLSFSTVLRHIFLSITLPRCTNFWTPVCLLMQIGMWSSARARSLILLLLTSVWLLLLPYSNPDRRIREKILLEIEMISATECNIRRFCFGLFPIFPRFILVQTSVHFLEFSELASALCLFPFASIVSLNFSRLPNRFQTLLEIAPFAT